MKKYLLFPLILCGNFAFSQLNEAFNDGNLTSNPVWTGSNLGNDFIIVAEQLRSNSTTASSNLYLSTVNNLAANCQWEFWVNLQFNTSSANYVDVYLTSDQANLQSASINGYFIRLGSTNDEICLFKRSGTTASSTKLIDGIDGILNTSNNKVKIRVTRTASNVFTLERDITGLGTSYITEGTFQDASFTTSGYFGIFIQQSTSSFFQKHFFDDFKINALNTDTSPPKLLSATVIDSTSLEILFDEPVDSVTAKSTFNYSINNSYGNPISVKTTADASKYILALSKGLNTASYLLTVSNIKDKAGNLISSDNTASFSFIKPFQAIKGDIVINEIFADPSPQIDLPSVEFIELFNPSNQTISLKNWKYSDPASTATLPADSIKSGEYLILCAKADTIEFKRFGKTIGISPWPTLNNASDIIKLVSPENKTIDSVAYSDTWYPTAIKKQGGWSLERINYKSVCPGLFNWTATTDSAGGTPGKQNSGFIPNYDQLAFKADSIQYLSDSTLNVYFNKPADISTQNNAFHLSPVSGNLKALIFDSNAKQAKLTYSSKFSPNTSYQLSVSQLKDCAGNSIELNSFQFNTPKLPLVRLDTARIYITEIFADPSPEIGLPLVEFVEIFNPGKDTIDMEGWTFNDPTAKVSINKRLILPKEYVILCPSADTALYKQYGKTIGLTPWPSLNNTSDQITLKSFKGRLVDSISYSDLWHQTDKKLGGWSLERIDYSSACGAFFNWTSSIDTNGGTPGRQNSVTILNYDTIAFKADSLRQLSDSTFMVYFNKSADPSTIVNSFTLNPSPTNLKSLTFDLRAKQATLHFSRSLLSNTSYQLTISNLNDCAGNKIISSSLSFSTPKLPPVRLDTAKLYITEIFADPSPEIKLPLIEFVELYNPGKDTVDLEGWTFNSSRIRRTNILPNEYLILCPAADTLQYKPFGKVAGLSPWPSLTNASDQVTLKSFKGRLVDSVVYSDTWHDSSIKKQGGWSLERLDYKSVCPELFNWASSIDPSGGTPGKQNSIYMPDYDKLAFKGDSIKQLSDTSINVYFNKRINISNTVNVFKLSPATSSVKSVTFDIQALKATLICEKFAANTSYQLSIVQLKDCAGNSIIQSPSLTFTTPKLPPERLDTARLFITEIFADPSPEVKLPLVEFIEIYNPGKDTIYLDGWTLNDPTTKTIFKNASILPQQYLILCPLADTLLYNPYGKTLGLSPWPSLNNASDQITLRSFKGRSVDSILYKDSWYKDSLKKSGGWSLERIENQSICTGAQNWVASNNSNGGTPGKQNSAYKLNSNQPLTIIQASLIDSLNISLKFNRAPDSLIASNSNNYIINNGVGKPSAVKINSDAFNEVSLKLSGPIQRGSTYKVTGSNIADCSGTLISASNNFAEFFYPDKVQKGDIVISEILFNPRTGGADFIEIYNNSNHLIDLKDISVSTIKAPDSIINRKNLTDNSKILEPGAYLVLTTDPENVKIEYHTENPQAFLKMASMPAFNNDQGTVVILSGESRIDQLDYTEKMHFRLIKDPKGVSLERSAFNRPGNEPGNFRSAAASVGHATPGYKNSQSAAIMLPTSEEIALTSKTLSPDNDGFEDALQINYQFKDAGMVANVSIYDDRGILIRRLAKNTTLAAEGTLIWDGMTDKEQIAEIGVYIIYFDVFNLNGHSKKFRKACVLAAKLN